jgi:Transposase DDE domain group 1
VVANRRGAAVAPEAVYDKYAERGESENRNKELKCGLHADRLSDRRYLANLFRLYLHAPAHNLLVRLRRAVADPPEPDPPRDLPAEALPGRRRKQYQNQRRQRDPLGEGHPCTWRTRLIKVAAEIQTHWRCVRVRLSGSWPFLDFYRQVSEAVSLLPLPTPAPGGPPHNPIHTTSAVTSPMGERGDYVHLHTARPISSTPHKRWRDLRR